MPVTNVHAYAFQVRYVTKLEHKPSFFHYFSEPSNNMGEDEDEEGDEEGGSDQYKLSVDEDYEVGHSFRAEIVPEAVLWFTGEAADDEDYDFEEGDEDEAEEGDEDEDGSGPDEESHDAVPKGGAGNAFGAATAGGDGAAQPGECKQN